MTPLADTSPPTHGLPHAGGVAAAIYFPVKDLRPWRENYRRNHRVVELARTILRTTWGAVVLAQASTRRIIGGHGRTFAALAILEGVEVDGLLRGGPEHYFDRSAPEPGMIPVRFLDVSDVEADAIAVADNARGLQGEDDVDLLAAHLARLGVGTPLLDDMGYTQAAVEALLAGAAEAAETTLGGLGAGDDAPRPTIVEDEPDLDRAEELRGKWGVELGQLWEIPSAHGHGVHRLLCGDATRAEDVARVLAGETPRWMWTDPPYGVEYRGKSAAGMTIENDDAEGLPTLLRGAFAAADGVLAPGAPIYVAHPSGPLSAVFAQEWQRIGWRWHQTLAWVKNAFVLGHADYHHQHEPILYGWKGKNRPWYGGRDKASVLFFDKPSRNAEHPTMKPVGLVAECIQNSARRGELGFEPFSGSGTTLAAAEQTGRLVAAVELAPKYVAVALERLAAMGLVPRRAG